MEKEKQIQISCCTIPERRDFSHMPSMRVWLDGLKMGHLLYNFVNNGFDDYEVLLLAACTQWRLSNEQMRLELGIEDKAERDCLMRSIGENSMRYLMGNAAVRYGLMMQDTTMIRDKACFCVVF
jgi:hypothetical protein